MKFDYTTFAPLGANTLAGHFPDNAGVGAALQRMEREFPDCVRYFEAGSSVEGRPIHAAVITNFHAEAEAKSHVVFSGAEHGTERNAAMTILEMIVELLQGDAEAAAILRTQEVTVVPVVNPDGYDQTAFTNRNGVNLFADYHFHAPPSQPESQALARVLEQSMPELFVSVHGHALDETKIRMTESTGIAFTNRACRCYSRELVETVNRAAEAAGFPQDRGEEDSQRILPRLNQAPEHSFEAFDRDECTSATWAYHQFHSLAMSIEVSYRASGILRLREFLRCGMRCWPGENSPGYPAWVAARSNHLFLTPAGATLAERRKNRIILWRNNRRITLFANTPGVLGYFFGGATFGYGFMRKLHELSERPYQTAPQLDRLLDFLRTGHETSQAFSPEAAALFHEAEAAFSIEPSALQSLDEPDITPPTAIRLTYRMPADATLVECRCDGQLSSSYNVFDQTPYRWLSVDIPLRPDWPVGSLYIHYHFNFSTSRKG